ncbi:MAG: hypothetical protein QOI44_2097 [Actinomycetota bacterium]|nr:hypothetical protein [Actinomycetota bacterium]
MTIEAKPGTRLRSVVCTTEVVVVRAAGDAVDLRCGGQAVIPIDEARPDGVELDAGWAEGTLLGKRYTDAGGTLELLCTKAGAGSLSIGDVPMQLSGAKPLPASD